MYTSFYCKIEISLLGIFVICNYALIVNISVKQQETAKDSMAGSQSGNKIWEDPLKTNWNAKVYLHVIYCKNIKWPWTEKVKVRVTGKGLS